MLAMSDDVYSDVAPPIVRIMRRNGDNLSNIRSVSRVSRGIGVLSVRNTCAFCAGHARPETVTDIPKGRCIVNISLRVKYSRQPCAKERAPLARDRPVTDPIQSEQVFSFTLNRPSSQPRASLLTRGPCAAMRGTARAARTVHRTCSNAQPRRSFHDLCAERADKVEADFTRSSHSCMTVKSGCA